MRQHSCCRHHDRPPTTIRPASLPPPFLPSATNETHTVREFVEHELEVREASWIAPNGDDDSGGYVAEARTALDALDLALLEKMP